MLNITLFMAGIGIIIAAFGIAWTEIGETKQGRILICVGLILAIISTIVAYFYK